MAPDCPSVHFTERVRRLGAIVSGGHYLSIEHDGDADYAGRPQNEIGVEAKQVTMRHPLATSRHPPPRVIE